MIRLCLPSTSRREFLGPGANLPGLYPRSRIRGREDMLCFESGDRNVV